MKCVCGSEDLRVIDSRSVDENNSIRRRRVCEKCGRRFTTYEIVEESPVLVVKSNGERQIFNCSKVKSGILKACEKRPISINQIDEMVRHIERKVYTHDGEINSKEIGEMVMEELKAVDDVAYVRFAAVYKKFADVESFMKFLKSM